jgi:hypothetical protein
LIACALVERIREIVIISELRDDMKRRIIGVVRAPRELDKKLVR